MKKFILLGIFTFFITSLGFSQHIDTLINADINPNRKVERIEVKFDPEGGYGYILKVDNKEYKGELLNGDYAYAALIDMDDSDGYIEIAIIDVGPSDGHDAYMFRFDGDIKPLGTISGMSQPDPVGNGIVESFWWMGFWGFNKQYKLKDGKIIELTKEIYPVKDVEATATQTFELRESRDENSKVAGTVKIGANVKFLEADITPVCINSAGYEDDDECDWFRVVTDDGTTGWVQLKDFRDKVDGLIWAG
ncbi:MAG: SH3 domain-containing protein [Ignavibacteriae bacterium]|nr:SH3 domain-containing protein [Ignavibacteriota bacterium]MCB9244631.1 SH3 domain-containing protein [Ignavibacteriales bacterium]